MRQGFRAVVTGVLALGLSFSLLVVSGATSVAQTASELRVAMTDTPDPASVGRQLVYEIKVTNADKKDFKDVRVEDTLRMVWTSSLPPLPTAFRIRGMDAGLLIRAKLLRAG